MEKIACATVVYKAAAEYLQDYFLCIAKQKFKDFELIVLNDDIPEEELLSSIESYMKDAGVKVTVLQGKKNFKPYELRVQLLEYAYEKKYDLLILSDVDDCFSDNRIGSYASAFDSQNAFYYNELRTFNGDKVMPVMPKVIKDICDIGESNFLGLSNTAISMKKLDADFIKSLYRGETSIFDWYLFSRIVATGKTGKKVEDCYTYYRIHENNLAGVSTSTLANVTREIAIKIQHYKLLKNYDDYYKKMYEKYLNQEEALKAYVPNEEKHFWWGLIRLG